MIRNGPNTPVGPSTGAVDMSALRPLGSAGSAMWGRIWAGNDGTLLDMDASVVQLLCESVDERQQIRERVLVDGDWRDRVALRSLDASIAKGLHMLGLTPMARHRLGSRVRPVPAGVLDELRARRRPEYSD